MAKSKYMTLARIKFHLRDGYDSTKDFGFLNFLVASVGSGKNFKIKSFLQFKIKLEDGTILQAMLKKFDFAKMFDLLELTSSRFDNNNSKFEILNPEFFEALNKSKLKRKIQESKSEKTGKKNKKRKK